MTCLADALIAHFQTYADCDITLQETIEDLAILIEQTDDTASIADELLYHTSMLRQLEGLDEE
jgi:hypothetical protein